MTTPLTITSLHQGNIAPRHDTDEGYWANFRAVQKPELEDLPHWYDLKIEWNRWPFKRADRA